MNNRWVKIICFIVALLSTWECPYANTDENLGNTTYILPNQDLNNDSDGDGLSDERERWWLCNPRDEDTNDDGILDGESVNFFSKDKTWPYRFEDLNNNNDVDGDRLPTGAEKYDVGTDFKSFSTDCDPYGDGQEYFDINMPKISPADHPLVAAYPDLSVGLTQIIVKPIKTIESTTGGSKQDAWSVTTETSDSDKNSFEWGMEQKIGFEGFKITGEAGFHETWVDESTHTTTDSSSTSGWSQGDWSSASTSNTAEAAKLGFILNVKNSGTIPAENVNPDVNIKLGKNIIATITSPTTISSIDFGDTSKDFLIDQGVVGNYPVDITASLEQLRFIDAGTPLNIETVQVRAKMKRWDGDKNEWVLMDQDVSTYMNEINRKSATLMFELNDGVYKKYKVFADSEYAPMTLGNAINLTIERDDVPQQKNKTWIFGFSDEALSEVRKLKDRNENANNLKLRPGWKILLKVKSDKPEPKIYWTGYSQDRRTIYASVTDDLKVKSVIAHLNIGGAYQDLNMTGVDGDTMYTLRLDQVLKRDEGNYVIATDIENNTNVSRITAYSSVGTPNQVWNQDCKGIEDWANPSDKFGSSLTLGDFNGDGFDDLVVDVPNDPAIHIIFGSVNGLEANNSMVLYKESSDWFRDMYRTWHNTTVGGDFNGNGIDDLVMGEAGIVLFDANLGKASSISDNYQGYEYIYHTRAAGDFNDDGIDDLAVVFQRIKGNAKKETGLEVLFGSKIIDPTRFGSSADQFIFEYGDQFMDDDFGRRYEAPAQMAESSTETSLAVGDFNSDGKKDLALGIPFWDKRGSGYDRINDAGAVCIFYSSSPGVFTKNPPQVWHQDLLRLNISSSKRFGYSLAVGDFNFDRIDDLAVGVPGISDTIHGDVNILFGSTRGISAKVYQLQSEKYGLVGYSMATGDLNCDGIDDLVVGEPGNDRVKIFFGPIRGTTPNDYQNLTQEDLGLNETSEGDLFGASLIIGDFNGDSMDDLAVGAPHEDIDTLESGVMEDAGAVYVVYGRIG